MDRGELRAAERRAHLEALRELEVDEHPLVDRAQSHALEAQRAARGALAVAERVEVVASETRHAADRATALACFAAFLSLLALAVVVLGAL